MMYKLANLLAFTCEDEKELAKMEIIDARYGALIVSETDLSFRFNDRHTLVLIEELVKERTNIKRV